MDKRNWSYLLSLLPGCIALAGNLLGGWYTLANTVFSLVLLGLFDAFLAPALSNKNSGKNQLLPETILILHVIVHTLVWMSLFWGIYTTKLNGYFIWIAALSSGIDAGAGSIVVAHELIHKANKIKQWLGNYLLATAGNVYFYVHHLRIHHKLVGTPEDAATARYNESLYQFVVRTMYQQFTQAWQSEARLLSKKGKSSFNFQNRVFRNVLLLLVINVSLFLLLGWKVVICYAIYMVTANVLLEYVNYIEHYGLERNADETVTENHSWNCDKAVSRFLLLDLSRHSDHHTYANKSYHALDTKPNAPVLPGGYVSLIVPAFIPFWWKALVHPKLSSYKNSLPKN